MELAFFVQEIIGYIFFVFDFFLYLCKVKQTNPKN